MAAELAAEGIEPLVAPLLAAEPTGARFPAGDYDHVIFVSEHAVGFANLAFQSGRGLLAEIAPEARWYAIGPATDSALAKVFAANDPNPGVRQPVPSVIVPEPARSEGLLLNQHLQHIAGDEVLIVAGVAGRALLADTLLARGALVNTWLTYRRVEQFPAAGTWPDCGAVDVLIASSGQGVELLTRQWLVAGGGVDVPLCVPSPRVFELALKLGWLNPVNCPGASAQATIAGLAQQGLWPASGDTRVLSNSTKHTE